MEDTIKICKICGKSFSIIYNGQRVYCSKQCAKKAFNVYMKNRHHTGSKIYNKLCPICNKSFKTIRSYNKYCADQCKQHATLLRHRNWNNSKNGKETIKKYNDSIMMKEVRKRYNKSEAFKKRKATIEFRIHRLFHGYILKSLKSKKNGHRWEKLVGYSVKDLIIHIESQFVARMSWGNFGEWEIDHHVPRDYLKYTSYEDENFKKCWALRNLKPLWQKENRSKSNKLPKDYVNYI